MLLLSRYCPPHPVAHQSLILATSIMPLSSRPRIFPAHRSPSSPPSLHHLCQDQPHPSSPCYTSEPHLGHSHYITLVKTSHLPGPWISELALCHSNLLCGLTLCHAENTSGLCVHRVALSPPCIEQQWGWRSFKALFIAPSPFTLTLCHPFPLPPTTPQSYTGTVLWLNVISLLSSTDYPFAIALRTHPCWLSIQVSKVTNLAPMVMTVHIALNRFIHLHMSLCQHPLL